MLGPKNPKKKRTTPFFVELKKAIALMNTGLYVDNLGELKKEAERRGLPLNFNPALPKNESLIQFKHLRVYLDALKPELVPAAKYAIQHLQMITLRDFMEMMKKNAVKLNNLLENRPYHALTVQNYNGKKSQTWVTDLACRFVSHLPETIIQLDHSMPDHDLYMLFHAEHPDFVMFDDGMYSGDQLSTYLNKIHRYLENNPVEKELRFTFVIGFVTERAQQVVKQAIEAFSNFPNVKINLISDFKVKSMQETLEEEGKWQDVEFCKKLSQVLNNDPRTDDYEKKLTKPLITTAWKLPDTFSTYGPFCLGHNSAIAKNKDKPVGPIVTDTKRPYRR